MLTMLARPVGLCLSSARSHVFRRKLGPSSLCPTVTPLIAAALPLPGVRMATSKAGGSTRNGRDSKPKYLGVKKFGGEAVKPGDIIVRQRGQR